MSANAIALLLAVTVAGGGPESYGDTTGAYSGGESGYYVTEGDNGSYAYGDGCLDLMPQNGYSPRYGCYPGNSRFIHRYPAFHGWMYRKPYNYRQPFDYPWHAGLHEPTSLFGYNVEEQEIREPREAGDYQGAENSARAKSGRYPTSALAKRGSSSRSDLQPERRQAESPREITYKEATPSRTLYKRGTTAAQNRASSSNVKPAAVEPVSEVQVASGKRVLDSDDMKVLLEEVERRIRAEDERDRAEGANPPRFDQQSANSRSRQLEADASVESAVQPAAMQDAGKDGVVLGAYSQPSKDAGMATANQAAHSQTAPVAAIATPQEPLPAKPSNAEAASSQSRNTNAAKVQITESQPARSQDGASKLSWRVKQR